MLYDLADPLHRHQFDQRVKALLRAGATVELRERRLRTLPQNAYLHCILSYFALQYGEDTDYVKYEIFKKIVNPDIFLTQSYNERRGHYRTLRSTASLSTDEMSTAIDRFRDYAVRQADIYLPSPDEADLLRRIDIELSRSKN